MCTCHVGGGFAKSRQIPHFDPEAIKMLASILSDIMELDDCQNEPLQMNLSQRRDVPIFVDSHPPLDMPDELVKGEYAAGARFILQISLARDAHEKDQRDQNIIASLYLLKKEAKWWLVFGDRTSPRLLVTKRVTVTKSLAVKLEFTSPKGTYSFKSYDI